MEAIRHTLIPTLSFRTAVGAGAERFCMQQCAPEKVAWEIFRFYQRIELMYLTPHKSCAFARARLSYIYLPVAENRLNTHRG
jgi:hypothetical protein